MKCLECAADIVGRVDKKFCSDYCRNAYNNKRYKEEQHIVREINKILKTNRKILQEMKKAGLGMISESSLVEKGYRINYATASFVDQEGMLQFAVYDQGIRYRGHGEYELLDSLGVGQLGESEG